MFQRRLPARPFRALLIGALTAVAASTAGAAEDSRQSPNAPYAFLIGHWDVAPESGGAPTLTTLFRFGPKDSYIWFAVNELADGAERPHLEGMFVWNSVHKKFDMLVATGLNGPGFEEQGSLSIEPDGTVVREITAFFPEGTLGMGQSAATPTSGTAKFRQTFKAVGPDRILTSVMRESAKGWVATFPGSDRLVMTRRKAG